jgi:hypothetical protein
MGLEGHLLAAVYGKWGQPDLRDLSALTIEDNPADQAVPISSHFFLFFSETRD